jgi:hypothetical protein
MQFPVELPVSGAGLGLLVPAPEILLVMVSGIDRRQTALAAGANSFLHYDEWLRIGTVAGELLAGSSRRASDGGSPSPDPAS